MTVLEEELLETNLVIRKAKNSGINQKIAKQILSKYNNGMSAEAIAKAEHVSVEDVNTIIKDNEKVLV